jgi:hypothetical protein
MAKFPDDILHSIEKIGGQISKALEEAINNLVNNRGENQKIPIEIEIKLSNLEGYQNILEVVLENLNY